MRNRRWFVFLWSLLVTACHPSSQPMTGPVAFSAAPIFMAAGRPNNTQPSEPPTILRARHVTVNFEALTVTATVLTLNLFEDVTLTAVCDRIERHPSGSFSWIGHLDDSAHSEVILVVKDGILVGNITLPQALYQIRYVRDGIHEVVQIDQAAFPPD